MVCAYYVKILCCYIPRYRHDVTYKVLRTPPVKRALVGYTYCYTSIRRIRHHKIVSPTRPLDCQKSGILDEQGSIEEARAVRRPWAGSRGAPHRTAPVSCGRSTIDAERTRVSTAQRRGRPKRPINWGACEGQLGAVKSGSGRRSERSERESIAGARRSSLAEARSCNESAMHRCGVGALLPSPCWAMKMSGWLLGPLERKVAVWEGGEDQWWEMKG